MGRFGDPYEKVLTFGTTLVDPGNKLRLTTAMIVLLSKKKKKIEIRICLGNKNKECQKKIEKNGKKMKEESEKVKENKFGVCL